MFFILTHRYSMHRVFMGILQVSTGIPHPSTDIQQALHGYPLASNRHPTGILWACMGISHPWHDHSMFRVIHRHPQTDTHGVPQAFHGHPQASVDILSAFMGIHRHPGSSMGIHGHPRASKGNHGHPQASTGIHSYSIHHNVKMLTQRNLSESELLR
jgi:hypothetical protein